MILFCLGLVLVIGCWGGFVVGWLVFVGFGWYWYGCCVLLLVFGCNVVYC